MYVFSQGKQSPPWVSGTIWQKGRAYAHCRYHLHVISIRTSTRSAAYWRKKAYTIYIICIEISAKSIQHFPTKYRSCRALSVTPQYIFMGEYCLQPAPGWWGGPDGAAAGGQIFWAVLALLPFQICAIWYLKHFSVCRGGSLTLSYSQVVSPHDHHASRKMDTYTAVFGPTLRYKWRISYE